ncbi:MAG: hypothetical protein U1E76_26295 [Planctomycetota bacterium]
MRHTVLVPWVCVSFILAAAATARGQVQPTSGLGTAATYCPPGIEDQATTGCLSASSIPTLGMLYPLSSDLYVDATTGFVGIGTTSPSYHLEINPGKLQLTEGTHEWLLDASDRFQFANNSVGDIFAVSSGGFFGIGITTPPFKFTVRNGSIADYNSSTDLASLVTNTSPAGYIGTYDGSDSFKPNTFLGSVSGCNGCGYMGVLDNNGTYVRAGMYLDGSVVPNGEGHVFADVIEAPVKHFRVPNPLDPNTEIWYACVEGPEAAAYVRGTAHLVHGRGVIALPDHFTSIVNEQGMTVQVTPLSGESSGLAVTRKSLHGIEVQELQRGTGTYDFDYEVKAVRKGFEDYRVVRPRVEVNLARPDLREAQGR